MTDDEWMVFRARYLNLNNIYIPDSARPLYDAPRKPPDAARAIEPVSTIKALPLPPRLQAEAPAVKREAATKPQLVFGLSEFLDGGQE